LGKSGKVQGNFNKHEDVRKAAHWTTSKLNGINDQLKESCLFIER
jgi:hypothetical protein